MKYTIPCLFGLEALVADELRRLDLKNVRAENGRVHCDGGPADIPRLNINLRCGARVLVELASFPAPDFEALFQGVAAIPWEDCIPRDGEFPVRARFVFPSRRGKRGPSCTAAGILSHGITAANGRFPRKGRSRAACGQRPFSSGVVRGPGIRGLRGNRRPARWCAYDLHNR